MPNSINWLRHVHFVFPFRVEARRDEINLSEYVIMWILSDKLCASSEQFIRNEFMVLIRLKYMFQLCYTKSRSRSLRMYIPLDLPLGFWYLGTFVDLPICFFFPENSM